MPSLFLSPLLMDGPPERCTAAEIAAVLAAAAQPESALLLDAPVDVVAGSCTLTDAQLWRVRLWHCPADGVTYVMGAQAPDGRTWQHGCQRHWTTTGEVVEPLDALTPEQRQALTDRLQFAVCWPAPEEDITAICLPSDRVQPKRRRGAR